MGQTLCRGDWTHVFGSRHLSCEQNPQMDGWTEIDAEASFVSNVDVGSSSQQRAKRSTRTSIFRSFYCRSCLALYGRSSTLRSVACWGSCEDNIDLRRTKLEARSLTRCRFVAAKRAKFVEADRLWQFPSEVPTFNHAAGAPIVLAEDHLEGDGWCSVWWFKLWSFISAREALWSQQAFWTVKISPITFDDFLGCSRSGKKDWPDRCSLHIARSMLWTLDTYSCAVATAVAVGAARPRPGDTKMFVPVQHKHLVNDEVKRSALNSLTKSSMKSLT